MPASRSRCSRMKMMAKATATATNPTTLLARMRLYAAPLHSRSTLYSITLVSESAGTMQSSASTNPVITPTKENNRTPTTSL